MLLDDAGIKYELDPTLVRGLDYYTRTVFEFSSDALGRPIRRRRRRALRPADGAARRAADARRAVGRPAVERMLLAAGELPDRKRIRRPVRRAGRAPDRAAQRGFELAPGRATRGTQRPARARRAARCSGQLKHADRLGARYVAIVGEKGRACSRTWSPASSTSCRPRRRDPDDPAREPAVVKHAPRPEPLPRRLVRPADRRARRHPGARRRLGAPPPRPRRADLHRPARPLGDRCSSCSTPRLRPTRTRPPTRSAPRT